MTNVVLVTGGLGYVGGRVALALQQSGKYELRLGTRAAGSIQAPWLPEAEIRTLDVTVDDDLDEACAGASSIVHLAALNENDCLADPQRAFLVNALGTLKLLQAAERAGVKRFVYFSTAHVYGAPLAGRIDEGSLPRPVHPYAITHHAAEDFVLAAHNRKAMVGIVLRMSNGFGSPTHAAVNRWTLIVNDLCRQAATAGKLVMRSPGLDQRDFITLEDAGRAVAHVLALGDKDVGDGLFNLGGGRSMKVFDLAQLVAQRCEAVLGFAPQIERPAATGAVPPPQLDYRMDKLLATGFSHRGSMAEEIDATLRICHAAFGNGK